LDTDFNMLSIKLAIFLLVMFALMILFVFIMKRIKGGSLSIGKYPIMKDITSLSLGPKKSLALIEVCDQWLLVGVGTENISLVSKIDKPPEYNQIDNNLPREGNIFESFLLKAGLKHNAPDTGSKKNEQ